MFHTPLSCSAVKLLNSLQFFQVAALMPMPEHQEDYENLTDNSSFCATHVVTVRPLQKSNTLPPTEQRSDQRTSERNNQGFVSGWLGIIDYPSSPTQRPKQEFYYFSYSILIDINSDRCIIQSPTRMDDSELTALQSDIASATSKPAVKAQVRHWSGEWSKDSYTEAFQRVQQYLLSGDCYQINLTMPFICQDDLTEANPFPLIAHFNAPFSVYFKTAERAILSVSPELFIRITGKRLETRPIKGTAPRSSIPDADVENIRLLEGSSKNQAENLMIVDLLRNDLSLSAKPHSVKVEKLFNIESHKNVHHLVSTISAELRDNISHSQAILNAFPGGSITGAPKRRAMEIIDSLESRKRNAYCGSFGYIDDSGRSEFNILIRTIIATREEAVCWGGGGVVADSTADDEYQEILNKVGMILEFPL